jgi:adenylate cyclase
MRPSEEETLGEFAWRVPFALAAALGACVGLGALAGGALDWLEWVTWDVRVNAGYERESVDPRIGIATIDHRQVDEFFGGEWPIPRHNYAKVLRVADAADCLSVAFDIDMSARICSSAMDSAAFGAALADVGRTCLPIRFDDGRDTTWSRDVPRPRLPRFDVAAWMQRVDARAVVHDAASFPVAALGRHAAMLGSSRVMADADGVVRRLPLGATFDSAFVPALSVGAWLAADPQHRGALVRTTNRGCEIGGARVPHDRAGNIVLRFRKPPAPLNVARLVAAGEALERGEALDAATRSALAGKYLLVGVNFERTFATPVHASLTGAELRAILLDNLLTDGWVRPAARSRSLVIAVLAASLAAFIGVRVGNGWLGLAGMIPIAAAVAGDAWVQYQRSVWAPVTAPLASLAVAGAGAVAWRFSWEVKRRRFVDNAFGAFVPRAVARQLIKHPERLRLGGESRHITAFFCDLADFTAVAERNEPTAVTTLLNRYMDDMANIVTDAGGTIDKFVGDAIVAFWNAPLDTDDHAFRAVEAARACVTRLDARADAYREILPDELRMRIGVCTGPALVGNLGSNQRFDYTAIGDTMNTASRLEGANRAFGTEILVSASTWAALGDRIPGRDIGPVHLAGKGGAVGVFQVFVAGRTPDAALLTAFNEAREAMLAGRIDEAMHGFTAIAAHDPVAARHADECAARARAGRFGALEPWRPAKT